jgi:hypothetical protein
MGDTLTDVLDQFKSPSQKKSTIAPQSPASTSAQVQSPVTPLPPAPPPSAASTADFQTPISGLDLNAMGEIPDEDGFMAKLAEDFARELAKMDSLVHSNAGFDPGNAEGEGGFQQSIRQTIDKLKASESTLKVRCPLYFFK